MPSPPREKGRTGARGSEEEFVLFIQGIPAHCRWQELKDLVRQTASHIRQAVVYDDQHGFPTGLGQIIVKNEDEAWRTYQRLASSGWDGQSLTVTLSRTNSPTRPIAGPTKSPPCVAAPPSYATGYSTPPKLATNSAVPGSAVSAEMPAMPTTPTYHSADYIPVLNPMGMTYSHLVPITSDSMTVPLVINTKASMSIPNLSAIPSPAYDAPTFPAFPYSQSTMQPIHETQNRIPLRGRTDYQHTRPDHSYHHSYGSRGAHSNSPKHETPTKCIFIQSLGPNLTLRDLKNHLSSAGTVKQCDLLEDRRTGRRKGHAKAIFQTVEEANQAVSMLDNSVFMGGRIRVKFDRDAADTAASKGTRVEASGETAGSEVEQGAEADNNADRRGSVPKINKHQPFVVNGSTVGKKSANIADTADYDKDLASSTRELRIA